MGWLTGWEKRKKLTFDKAKIDENLTDFPVLVYISASSGITGIDLSDIFDELGSYDNRKKIAVTTSDGETQCYVEIEKWDQANEKAWLWVKAPSVSSSEDTTFYIYYDSTHADNTAYVGDTGDTPAQNVWDSNFEAVYHLGEASGDCIDSTSNGKNGTFNGNLPTQIDGKVAKAQDLDGTSDYIDLGDNFDWEWTGQKTLEAIIKPESISGFQTILRKEDHQDPYEGWSFRINNKLLNFKYIVSYPGPGLDIETDNDVVDTDAFYYVAATFNNNSAKLWLNESAPASTYDENDLNGSVSTDIHTRIGSDNNGNQKFSGIIDEVRISSIERSDAWKKATSYSCSDNLINYELFNPSECSEWKKIRVDHSKIDAALSDFPLLFHISSSSGISSADVTEIFTELGSDANRKKIAVTTSDGETQCYVEIEKWDHASQEAWLWIKAPSISSDADTDFYLYYDSSQPDNLTYIGDTGESPARSVWPSMWKGAWHMGQDPSGGSGSIKDSTSNANHGTPQGSMTSDDLVDAQIGKGIEFDGVDDHIIVDDADSLDTNDITVLGLIHVTETVTGRIASKWWDGSTATWGFYIYDDILTFRAMISGSEYSVSSSDLNPTNYQLVAGVFDSSEGKLKLYIDGVKKDELSQGGSIGSNSAPLKIGKITHTGSYTYYFNSIIDELKICGQALSGAWIKAEFYSFLDNLLTWLSGTQIEASITAPGQAGAQFEIISYSDGIEAEAAAGAEFDLISYSDEFKAEGRAGAQFERILEAARELHPDAAGGAQFTVGLEVEKAITASARAGVAFSCLNWTRWLSRYRDIVATRYFFTLTGAADGKEDIIIPIASFQGRIRSGDPTFLSVTIRGTDYFQAVSDRPNGEMIIHMAFLLSGQEVHREEIARAALEDIRLDQGGKSRSMVLTGHKTDTWQGKTSTLHGVTYKSLTQGKLKFRASPDLYLRPGDTVKAGDDEFTAGLVSWNVSVGRETMEVTEA